MKKELAELLKKRIYIGTSSWKYEGWRGLVYHHNYSSEKNFNENCLKEYAATFPTVGVDHTYYAWPSTTTFQKYMDQTPSHFKFGIKVTEKITVLREYAADRAKAYARWVARIE